MQAPLTNKDLSNESEKKMSAIRMLFTVLAAVILAGIWLTGFDTAHWLLYFPPAALLFAAITGICPGYMVFRKLGFKGQTTENKI